MTPPEVRLVLTREAAEVLGCCMRQVRNIAIEGKVKSWSLGRTSFAYDIEDLRRYGQEKEASRRAGTPPQGFSAHVSPPRRKKS
jgi:hypothetical protein